MLEFQRFELEILRGIQNTMQSDIMDSIMVTISKLGDKGLVWIGIIIILLISKKNRKVGIMAILALVLATALGEGVLKNLIGRERPFVGIDEIKLLIKTPSTFSFPSGHTMSSFAVATVLYRNLKSHGIYFVMLAMVMAFSRMYLFVHYPTDILVGMFLGIVCGEIGEFVYKKIRKEKNPS